MIPTRDEIEALPPALFAALRHDVMSVHATRTRVGQYKRVNGSFAFSHSSYSATLAAMQVGEQRVFPEWTSPARLTTTMKRYARRRMDAPDARWTARTLNKGVRVTRVR